MSIKTERILGKKIICEIDSSTVQDCWSMTRRHKNLLVTFKGELQYEYE